MRFRLPSRRRFKSDADATAEGDAIDRAANWARHIMERDFPDAGALRAVLVVEAAEENRPPIVFYSSDTTDIHPIMLHGLMSMAMHLAQETVIRQRIREWASEVGSPSEEETRKMVEGLLRGESDVRG